jgi:uncharacterized membrane protein
MTNLMKALILNAVLIVLLAGGFVYVNNVQAESDQPTAINLVDIDFTPFADAEIVVAQNTCGDEVCTDSQCCCLNIDNGNQCCRPKMGDNCVESCKKSDPC